MFNILRCLSFSTILFTTVFWNSSLYAQETQGTLVVDVKPFTSEIRLKKKILRQLESGGLPWGVSDGQLVMTQVNRRFIAFELPHMTRYGQKKVLKLAPGTYRISCAGLIYKGGMSPAKVLRKGAYFNIDTLTFKVSAGKTTILEVLPVIQKSRTLLVKVYIPDLHIKVIENGVTKAEKTINKKVESSIAWEDYSGSLKFKSKTKEKQQPKTGNDDF